MGTSKDEEHGAMSWTTADDIWFLLRTEVALLRLERAAELSAGPEHKAWTRENASTPDEL